MLCKTCGAEMVPMFTGNFCKNHCDLPADKAAVARKKDQDAKPVSTTPPVGKVPAGNGQAATSAGGIAVRSWPNCPVCSANLTYVVNGKYHCGLTYCNHSWSPPVVAVNVDPNWWNGPITIRWQGGTIDVYSDPDCPDGVVQCGGVNFANPVTIALKNSFPKPNSTLYAQRDAIRREGMAEWTGDERRRGSDGPDGRGD